MESNRAIELAEKRRIWRERLDEWEASGLTQVNYCRLHNLDTRNFQYWKRKTLPKPCTPTLVELPTQLVSQSTRPAGSPLCLVVNARFRVEVSPGFDADTLDRLIKVLYRP